jgi:hypothetical protein
MTGLEIAALIAMLAGTAVQYKATTDARDRQDQATRDALMRQNDLQQQAEKKALGQAQEFNTDSRAQQQGQIEQQMAQDFAAPAESAQQIHAQQATTQGDVSKDYSTAKAAADVNTLKNARALAGLLAKTTSANRLRGNEAIRMADTAAGIDRLGSFSRGQAAADNIGINIAGRPDAGLMLAGGALQSAGGAYLGSGAGAGGGEGAAAGELGSGTYQTPIPTGTGTATPIPQNTTLGTGFWGMNGDAAYAPKLLTKKYY